MKTRMINAADPAALDQAHDVIANHGLVAFPTDTVYGLASGAFDPRGVDLLYSVKGRNHTKAIAVLLADISQLEQVAVDFPEVAEKVAAKFWPGPLTLVVPRGPNVPEVVSQYPTIGVRIPDHPVALRLLDRTGPLAVTSANLSGAENTHTADDVLEQLDGRFNLLIDGGKTPGGLPSTVLDCTSSDLDILREGPIKLSEIRELI